MPQSQSLILLADESKFFLTMEKQFLRNVPAQVLEAQSAAQTLELCRSTPPDLIYLADTLEDRDGISFCREIRANKEFAEIPVIFVCDTSIATAEEMCREFGCNAVLTKPLDRHHFLATGRKFLAGIREPRRSCLIGVQAQVNDRLIEGRGLDISSGGVFLETNNFLDVNTELQLDLRLARPHEQGPSIQCKGVVAWLNTRENPIKPKYPVGLGIKFVDIPLKHVESLNRYIQRLDQSRLLSS